MTRRLGTGMPERVPGRVLDSGLPHCVQIHSPLETLWVDLRRGILGWEAPGTHDPRLNPDCLQNLNDLIRHWDMAGSSMVGPGDG